MPTDAARTGVKWALHDEKYVLAGKGAYQPKSPQLWLQDVRDYLAGRCSDMDRVLDWVESRRDEIEHSSLGSGFPMLEHIGVHPTEVSRQLWALLGPLVAADPSLHSVFANVPRHNGLLVLAHRALGASHARNGGSEGPSPRRPSCRRAEGTAEGPS